MGFSTTFDGLTARSIFDAQMFVKSRLPVDDRTNCCGKLAADYVLRNHSLFVFGHVGLTIGAAYGSRLAASRWTKRRIGQAIDYRVIVVGSMLPDLIDKPLGLWIAPDLVDGSLRSIGHTLIFAIALLIAGAAFWRAERGAGVALFAASSAGHVVLDLTWRTESILLWPFLGWEFGAKYPSPSQWASQHLFDALRFFTDYPELAGFLVIVAFSTRVVYTKNVRRFLLRGIMT
ncbi:MAG: metal-dependent hydrolase [SAR202 cluster bacterium]|jgi:hypothetical protein|nr:metal-dependent hydrolase [SAR202 cluster bacterium]MDP6302689.1 metal-dependent hydrolase [SAR202 cluster bacterium]MDP7103224.1 metal-dependent hydrolase [SAR202 cluster bacterium]MDP7414060.1 metal-dependent hydrolase [SAR202 cluster bacterium]HJO81563.1 metal-dependent hydrolase [SAR202 cluster bacterium]|tara:strand:- start:16922 stop:17617 length:696 start_codon:yes stop_codon:yes gene_type:complete